MSAGAAGGSRTLLLIVVVLGVVTLALYGYLFGSGALSLPGSRAGQPPSERPPASTAGARDLWGAYEAALRVVRARASDAELVSTSARWQAAAEEEVVAGTSDWTFVFYSAERGAVLDVIADGLGVQVVNESPVWSAPRVLGQGTWRAGPRDALVVFLEYGGRDFLREHGGLSLDLHLSRVGDVGAAWTVVAVTPAGSARWGLQVAADSGRVVARMR